MPAADQHCLHQQLAEWIQTSNAQLSSCLQAWYQYGAFCMRVMEHTRAQAAFREALSLSQEHSPAAAALACLGLALSLGKDIEGGPEPAALEWVEVLGHSLKDTTAAAGGSASAAGALPWALLALLYRMQGEDLWRLCTGVTCLSSRLSNVEVVCADPGASTLSI
jgi:hypothetical protein